MSDSTFDTIIIGAGAAGLFCAAHAGGRVLVLDHAKAPGEKIRISGGGRCNFTNLYTGPENFLSQNPHFAKSALARYTPWDFIGLVDRHAIAWHEKEAGQLFCDGKATQIVDMLIGQMRAAGGALWLQTPVLAVEPSGDGFRIRLPSGTAECRNLVIATGGKSIPRMGATGFAYDIARQFGHAIREPRPGLVPLTFSDGRFASLSGVSVQARLFNQRAGFTSSLLFTHRGLSGPAILQLSSYWREGEAIGVDLIPDTRLADILRSQRQREGRRNLTTELAQHLPARLVDFLTPAFGFSGNLADQSDTRLHEIEAGLRNWQLTPAGSEGYRTAEVTLGGIDTDGLSSKTMMSKTVPGLYFIGECVDVTGQLGGFNFQWAWASAYAAGQAIASSGPD